MSYNNYFNVYDPNSTLEEKMDVLESNSKVAEIMRKELSELRKVRHQELLEREQQQEASIFAKSEEDSEDKEITQIIFALSNLPIASMSEEEIYTKIMDILSISKRHFQDTIKRVKIALYQEILSYAKLFKDTKNAEEVKDIEMIIHNYNYFINVLDDLEMDEVQEEVIKKIGHIFFLKSDAGNVIALENLRKTVPREYYSDFYRLLKNLQNNQFIGFKKLCIGACYEIKDFKVRILFAKLNDNDIVILDAFMKKYDTSLYYRRRLSICFNQYLKNKKYFLEHCQDDAFIKEHEGHLEELVNLLGEKELGCCENGKRSF